MSSVIDLIHGENPEKRQAFLIDAFVSSFGDLIKTEPASIKSRFRKMAATPFTFYRGSAVLFYADMAREIEQFVDEKTNRVWIQGDLHARNFGTYMNSAGLFVFDVNDFDEAYVGPYTWDIKRLVASLALIGYQKALSDDEIRAMMSTLVRSYVDQVSEFAKSTTTANYALMMENTSGELHKLLQKTRLLIRFGLLDQLTTIENFDRHIIVNKDIRPIDKTKRSKVMKAFEQYLETIPAGKRMPGLSYKIKDISETLDVGGIGSTGLLSYYILLEGPTQALENDIFLYMKQAQVAAPSRVISDTSIRKYFLHDGHRSVISQRAMQAYADPWLGYTTLDGKGQLVAEISPYEGDLAWDDINDMDELLGLIKYLGQAAAKVHCISEVDSDQTLVPFSTDEAIHHVLDGQEDVFVKEMVKFGEDYSAVVRDDHRLFIDAFRNHRFPNL